MAMSCDAQLFLRYSRTVSGANTMTSAVHAIATSRPRRRSLCRG